MIIAAPRAEEVLDTDRLRTDEAKEADLQFLEDQRGPRKLFIGNRDMQYDNKVKAKSDRIEKKRRYEDTQREKEEKDHNSKATEEPVSDPIDVDDNGNEEDFVDYESEKRRKIEEA